MGRRPELAVGRRGTRGRRAADRGDRGGGARRGRPALERAPDRGLLRQPGGHRPPVPERPPARVRDHVDRAPGRRGRRGRPRRPFPPRGRRGAPLGVRPGRHLVPRGLRRPVRDGGARRPPPPQPADRAALARDHAQRRQPRPDRVRAPLGPRGRPGVRARRDGGRRVRGRRRARADRGDVEEAPGPGRRQAELPEGVRPWLRTP